eukprot:353681-Chlamydomonas_euryale.AAC.4
MRGSAASAGRARRRLREAPGRPRRPCRPLNAAAAAAARLTAARDSAAASAWAASAAAAAARDPRRTRPRSAAAAVVAVVLAALLAALLNLALAVAVRQLAFDGPARRVGRTPRDRLRAGFVEAVKLIGVRAFYCSMAPHLSRLRLLPVLAAISAVSALHPMRDDARLSVPVVVEPRVHLLDRPASLVDRAQARHRGRGSRRAGRRHRGTTRT